jgi:hypothetical protein
MASQEGAQRIKTVGKFIILIGCTIDVLIWMFLFGGSAGAGGLFYLALMLITPVVFGGIVWALAWILEGYKQPPHSDDES